MVGQLCATVLVSNSEVWHANAEALVQAHREAAAALGSIVQSVSGGAQSLLGAA